MTPHVDHPRSMSSTTTTGARHQVLIIIAIVLVAAGAGVGAWVVNDRMSTNTSVINDVAQLLDDYSAAWNDWDGEAFLTLVTDEATFRTAAGTTGAHEQADLIDSFGSSNWHIDRVGEPVISGDGPWYVAQPVHLSASTYPAAGYDGIATFTIVDVDGMLRVADHAYTGES